MSNTGLWWVKNVVLRVTRRKKFKMFPYAVSFSCAFDEKFIEDPWSLVLLFFFCKTLRLIFLTVFWILFSQQLLSNLYRDLILCTASDIFRILVFPALSYCSYMPAYLIILCVIKIYTRILRPYSFIFSPLWNPHILRTLSYSEPWHI